MNESFWRRLVIGYSKGEKGYVRSIMSGHPEYEFLANAPLIWVVTRIIMCIITVGMMIPIICLYSLIAKLQGKKVVKKIQTTEKKMVVAPEGHPYYNLKEVPCEPVEYLTWE